MIHVKPTASIEDVIQERLSLILYINICSNEKGFGNIKLKFMIII